MTKLDTAQTFLIYTKQPPAKFNMPLVHRLNHNNIITLKSPLGLPQNNNQTKPFIGVWDLVTELQVYVQYSIKMR